MDFCETCNGTGYVCAGCDQPEDACTCDEGCEDPTPCDDCGGTGDTGDDDD